MEMLRERSAGIILFHEHPREYLVLLKKRTTDFPRGKVKPGETEEAAALRETREETGVTDVTLIPGFRRVSRFTFGKDEMRTFKTITYFLGKTKQVDIVLSKEHKGFVWLVPEKALAKVHFKNQKEILRKAEEFLK